MYDPNFLLTKLTPLVSDWADLRGARLYIDGFTSLTPQQIAFVVALAEHADATVITLPLPADLAPDSAQARVLSLLDVPEHVPTPMAYWTWQQLTAAAEAAGLSPQQSAIDGCPRRFAEAPDLACLERLLYAEQTAPVAIEPTRVQIAEAQSVQSEVSGVAEQICRLLAEEDARFRDILVLVSDPEAYQPVIADVFETFHIPFHTDQPVPFASHPLARFLLAALRAVRDHESIEAMTRLLRSPFTGFNLDDVDWLENYLLTYEVTGMAWFAEGSWHYARDNRENDTRLQQAEMADAQAERLRRRVLHVFGDFLRQLAQPVMTSLQLGQALWSLLERVHAKQEIAEWIAGQTATVDPMQASLHEQAWLTVVALLNDLGDTRPDQPLPTSFLFQLVEETLTGSGLMTIPEGLDEATVFPYTQAAGVHAKWVFVLGAVDGTLPRRIHQDSIVLDDEREIFRALFGRQLGWTTQERQQAERALPYLVCTRASQRLMISYPLATDDGKAVRPALLVNRIQEIFRHSIERCHFVHEVAGEPGTDWSAAVLTRMDPQAVWERLLPAVRSGTLTPQTAALGRAVLSAGVTQRSTAPWLQATIAGWRHRTQALPLSADLTRQLYGQDIHMNVHQLEAHAQCAFRHFGQYGLRLQEEQMPDINAAVRGTLLHDAVEQFVHRQMDNPSRLAELGDDEATAEMDEILDSLLSTPKMQVWARTRVRMQQAQSVRQVLHAAALVLTRHLRHGSFRPQAIELNFGDTPDAMLGSWSVPIDDELTLHLRGRIDRVDTVETEDGMRWFRIIDYKSSNMELDLSKVAHGLQLQLPVYAIVIQAQSEALFGGQSAPAGLLYLPLRHQVTASARPETEAEALQARIAAMRANGRVVANDAVIAALDERILSGTSELFKRFYNKDNGFLKSAPVLSPSDWNWMLEQVQAMVIRLGRSIARGEIAISPAKYGSEEACRFCPLASVCSIDRKTDQGLFRVLPKWSGDTVSAWRQWLEVRVRKGSR